MGIEGKPPEPIVERPIVVELFTPGEVPIDADGVPLTTEEVLGPWTPESLTEFAADGVDLSKAALAAAKQNPRFIS